MPGFARVAVYYAPAADDPLAEAAARWLGRDPASGVAVAQPDFPDIAAITAEARLYGFHATLKPPMRLARGTAWPALLDATAAMARTIAPFDLPRLAVSDIHGFLALRETAPCPPLQALADRCVADLDAFRAPPDDAELARRRRAGLTAGQDAMLVRWGYPYVFGTWFFHMTITRRLTAGERSVYRPATEAHFAEALRAPRRVADICLYTQAETDGPFAIAERIKLRG